eukprot:GEMP01037888.1.p2 GENE.GEMP01037888.1~~GEMP01037888.1.p2  ORF type:complete len:153 (+),score=35.27 GEMP01037888.1:106-564(+)
MAEESSTAKTEEPDPANGAPAAEGDEVPPSESEDGERPVTPIHKYVYAHALAPGTVIKVHTLPTGRSGHMTLSQKKFRPPPSSKSVPLTKAEKRSLRMEAVEYFRHVQHVNDVSFDLSRKIGEANPPENQWLMTKPRIMAAPPEEEEKVVEE